MKPGIAVMPFASITFPLVVAGAPAAADTILPPRTTMDPRSMTVPLATTIRALVIVASCAYSESVRNSRQASVVRVKRFIDSFLPAHRTLYRPVGKRQPTRFSTVRDQG